MKAEVVSKDMGAGENGAKVWVALEYSFACPRTRLRKRCLRTRGSCWGKGTKFKLVTKAWVCKKNSFISFPNHLLENA